MTEPLEQTSQEARDERGSAATEADALTSAIEHIRAAKGVLDTFPETRAYVGRVEKLADDYEKKLRPLEDRLAAWREEARRMAPRPR